MVSVIEIAVVFAVAVVAVVVSYSFHTGSLAHQVARAQHERSAALARSCPPADEQTAPAAPPLDPVLQFSTAQILWAQRAKAERAQTGHAQTGHAQTERVPTPITATR